MNAYQTLLAMIAAAGLAGCAGTPAWEKPKPRPRLIEEKPVEKPKETPKEMPKETMKETTEKYERVPLAVIYYAEDKTTAALLRGYAKLSGVHPVEAAFEADKDKNGIASYSELSDMIEEYRKKHGGEIKLLPEQDGTVFSQAKTITLPKKRAAEMKKEYDNAESYERMMMRNNWEKTYK
ncbi:MAG: hypothetical protein QW165_01755 [Candidatus Woesearchaeota archaeon]